jgi:hypothetical protein
MTHAQLKENLADALNRIFERLMTRWLSSDVAFISWSLRGIAMSKSGLQLEPNSHEECRR